MREKRKKYNGINPAFYACFDDEENAYAVIKAVLNHRFGLALGGVRKPLANPIHDKEPIIVNAVNKIEQAIAYSQTL